jgi:hypothetical protein
MDIDDKLGFMDNSQTEALKALAGQLVILFVKREGGEVVLPVSEIDDTGQDILSYHISDDRLAIKFIVNKKQ